MTTRGKSRARSPDFYQKRWVYVENQRGILFGKLHEKPCDVHRALLEDTAANTIFVKDLNDHQCRLVVYTP